MSGKNKDKPISYYARYLGGHPRYPGDQDIGVYVHPTLLELAFKGHSIIIPYSEIKNITNLDKGKVFDGGNIATFGVVGLLMKRKVNAMIIEYNDAETSEIQTVGLDFWNNTKHAQPIIYDRMNQARTMPIITEKAPTQIEERPMCYYTKYVGGTSDFLAKKTVWFGYIRINL